MFSQDQIDNLSASSFNRESSFGSHAPTDRPIRRDTASTVGSINETVPPGIYTLPVQGNCPKCHHHHKAAKITVPAAAGPSQANGHVYCDNCHEKWLTFGARSSTISLISTQTIIEPDVVQQDFRSALVDMVKSVTSIASPTALASVPEVPSGLPSREPSTRSHNVGNGQARPWTSATTARSSVSQDNNHPPTAPIANDKRQAAPPAIDRLDAALRGKQPRLMLRQLKAKLKHRLLELKKFRPSRSQLNKERNIMENVQVEPLTARVVLPSEENDVSFAPPNTHLNPAVVEPQGDVAATTNIPSITAPRPRTPPVLLIPFSDGEKVLLRGMAKEERVALFQEKLSPSKEQVIAMPKEQRIAWAREQYTHFKHQLPMQQQRRHTQPSTDLSHTDDNYINGDTLPPPRPSPQSPPQRPQRRYSADLPFMGGHLDSFEPGELYISRRFSISSTTRLSEAPTAVNSDHLTVTSGPPSLDVSHQHQHSRSPRPRSIQAGQSRLRHSVGPGEVTGRPSIDSTSSTAAVRSFTGVGVQIDQHSVTSAPSIRPAPSVAPSLASVPSIPYINGHRASGDWMRSLHRRSSSTTAT